MPKNLDATALTAAWIAGMSSPNAVTKYKAGIDRQTVSPTAKAATPDALQRAAAGVQAAIASGKTARALNSVQLADWQNAAKTKGANNLSLGAKLKQAKFMSAMQKWASIYQQASQAAANLPRGGMANALARVQASLQVLMSAAGTA